MKIVGEENSKRNSYNDAKTSEIEMKTEKGRKNTQKNKNCCVTKEANMSLSCSGYNPKYTEARFEYDALNKIYNK